MAIHTCFSTWTTAHLLLLCVSVPLSTSAPPSAPGTISVLIGVLVTSMVGLIIVITTVSIAICCVVKKRRELAMAQRWGAHEVHVFTLVHTQYTANSRCTQRLVNEYWKLLQSCHTTWLQKWVSSNRQSDVSKLRLIWNNLCCSYYTYCT